MEITSLLNKILSQRETSDAATPVATVSLADEIMKLKQLSDMVALTEEEFSEAKRQALGL